MSWTTSILNANLPVSAGVTGESTFIFKQWLYVVGGSSAVGSGPSAAIWAFPINGSNVGVPKLVGTLPTTLYHAATVVYGDYLYVVGGLVSGTGSSWSNKILVFKLQDGSAVHLPQYDSAIPNAAPGADCMVEVIEPGWLFVFTATGAAGGGQGWSARLNSDGSVGKMQSILTPFKINANGVLLGRLCAMRNALYMIGGQDAHTTTTYLGNIAAGMVDPATGQILSWTLVGGLATPRSRFGADLMLNPGVLVVGGGETAAATVTSSIETFLVRPDYSLVKPKSPVIVPLPSAMRDPGLCIDQDQNRAFTVGGTIGDSGAVDQLVALHSRIDGEGSTI